MTRRFKWLPAAVLLLGGACFADEGTVADAACDEAPDAGELVQRLIDALDRRPYAKRDELTELRGEMTDLGQPAADAIADLFPYITEDFAEECVKALIEMPIETSAPVLVRIAVDPRSGSGATVRALGALTRAHVSAELSPYERRRLGCILWDERYPVAYYAARLLMDAQNAHKSDMIGPLVRRLADDACRAADDPDYYVSEERGMLTHSLLRLLGEMQVGNGFAVYKWRFAMSADLERHWVAVAAGVVGYEKVIPELETIARDQTLDRGLRVNAIRVLGDLAGEDARETLVALLSDPFQMEVPAFISADRRCYPIRMAARDALHKIDGVWPEMPVE